MPTICYVLRQSMGKLKVTFRVPTTRAWLWMESNRRMLPAVAHVPAMYSSPNPNLMPNLVCFQSNS